jgi:hypothetical protein
MKANPEKEDASLFGLALEQIIRYVIFSQLPSAKSDFHWLVFMPIPT